MIYTTANSVHVTKSSRSYRWRAIRSEDELLDDPVCVSGVMAYMFELRMSVRDADGEGEPQGDI